MDPEYLNTVLSRFALLQPVPPQTFVLHDNFQSLDHLHHSFLYTFHCFYYWDRLVEMLTVTGGAWLELHLYFCPSGDVPGPGMLFTA